MPAERFGRRIYFRIPNLALDHPLSELDGLYIENPLAKSLLRTAPLRRLKGVGQLGLLVNNSGTESWQRGGFYHTRYEHTGVVTDIGERVLRQNGLDEHGVNTGIAGFILHDLGTVGFGDSTKPLDSINLDEEAHWREASNRRITTLLKRNNISLEEVDAVIRNEGVLGKVLDIADRTAYVTRDLSAWMNDEPRRIEHFGRLIPTPDEIEAMSEEDLNMAYLYIRYISRMGDIYNDVVIDKDAEEVYFKDVNQLRFLLAYRAALHRGLYMHPLNMGREAAFVEILRPFYTADEQQAHEEDQLLSPSKLRKMTDRDVEDHIRKYGTDDQKAVYMYLRFMHWVPSFEKFETVEQAKQREQDIIGSGARIIGVREVLGFNPSTDLKVLDKQGNVVSFRDADPYGTSLIDAEVEKVRGAYLFYTSDEFKMTAL